jgi:hypothetical protein
MAKREITSPKKSTSSTAATTATPTSTTSVLKVYRGFSRTVPQSANGYRIGAGLNPHFRIKKIVESVQTFCKAKDIKALEVLISTPEVVILDAEFVEVLKLIAAEGKTRTSDLAKRRALLTQLITSKTFSCTTLRRHIAEKLTLNEAIELIRLCVNLLFSIMPQSGNTSVSSDIPTGKKERRSDDASCGRTEADNGFERTLELCAALLDSHIYKLSANEDGSSGHYEILNEQMALIEEMIKLCEHFTRIESIADARRELPVLMKPPFSDYHIEKFELDSVNL